MNTVERGGCGAACDLDEEVAVAELLQGLGGLLEYRMTRKAAVMRRFEK